VVPADSGRESGRHLKPYVNFLNQCLALDDKSVSLEVPGVTFSEPADGDRQAVAKTKRGNVACDDEKNHSRPSVANK
jgi:hypothetical protein